MRVLHLSYDDVRNPWVGGGGAVRAHEIYRRLTPFVETTVVTGAYPGARDEVIDGVRYRRLGRPAPYAWSRWTYSRAATRLLRAGDYHAAVLDHSIYTPVTLPRRAPVGINVAQLPGRSARARWGRAIGVVLERVELRRLRGADAVSVVSEYLRGEVAPLARPGARLFVVPAGVDDELFQVQREEQDYVLYYGRFDVFQKGIDVLIRAAPAILARHPGVRLVLAGRGRDVERIRSMIVESGLDSVARVEVDIDPPRRAALFAGAQVLAMPSRFEGFGMVAAEAMAAGVPVVASDRDSLPEVVGGRETGVLFRPEDPTSLADAVSALLDDPAERARLSRSGRARARRFGWDSVAASHLDFLQHVAAHQ